MPEHINFYENLKEAKMRLAQTVVVYDGKPYYVCAITDHKPDGIFRMYLDPFDQPLGLAVNRLSVPINYHPETPSSPSHGDYFDKWLEKNPDSNIVRKTINSPKFNKFRPFPLGMCHQNGKLLYLERQPVRITQQGLHQHMIVAHVITLGHSSYSQRLIKPGVSLTSSSLGETIVGNYPSPQECLENLLDPECDNIGAAFSRHFGFMRGPADTMFLCYKSDIIGLMPQNNMSEVVISKEFQHTAEVVTSCNLFADITIK